MITDIRIVYAVVFVYKSLLLFAHFSKKVGYRRYLSNTSFERYHR